MNTRTRGRFITFEGIDGAGKTTQINAIEALLHERGIDTIRTREPGGTVLGEKLREMLLHDPMLTQTELMLLFAARLEHVKNVIEPALAAGKWVLCDRFSDSSYAYQVGGKGLDSTLFDSLEAWTLGEFGPDHTLLFDLDPETAKARRGIRAQATDKFEAEKEAFFVRVRNAYLERAHAHPKRITRIDSTQSVDAVTRDVLLVVQSWL